MKIDDIGHTKIKWAWLLITAFPKYPLFWYDTYWARGCVHVSLGVSIILTISTTGDVEVYCDRRHHELQFNKVEEELQRVYIREDVSLF